MKKTKEIKICNPDINEIRAIRNKILYESLPKSFSNYLEDKMDSTKHFGLKVNSKIISIATLNQKSLYLYPNEKALQIRGMATLKDFQKKGYGSLLIENIIRILKKEKKIDLIWCNARIKIMDFYTKKLFTPIGDIFDIKSIGPHKSLYYRIKNDK